MNSVGRALLESLRSLLHEIQNLIKLGCEQIEGSQDSTIRSQMIPCHQKKRSVMRNERLTGKNILLHDFLVVNCISNVDIRLEGNMSHCRIEVQNVWRSIRILSVQIGVDALYKS